MARELHKYLTLKVGVPVITWLIIHLQVWKLIYECQNINKQKVNQCGNIFYGQLEQAGEIQASYSVWGFVGFFFCPEEEVA